jgi:hypothetical protein
VHPGHHRGDHTLVEEEEEPVEDADAAERARMAQRPWWKRPSPLWFLAMAPLSTLAGGATVAPRVEILTMLVCDHLKPEYTAGHGMEDLGIHTPSWGSRAIDRLGVSSVSPFWERGDAAETAVFVPTTLEIGVNGTIPSNPKLCKTDPVVQAGVAKLQGSKSTGLS